MEGAFFTESDLASADRGRLTTAEDDLLAVFIFPIVTH